MGDHAPVLNLNIPVSTYHPKQDEVTFDWYPKTPFLRDHNVEWRIGQDV